MSRKSGSGESLKEALERIDEQLDDVGSGRTREVVIYKKEGDHVSVEIKQVHASKDRNTHMKLD